MHNSVCSGKNSLYDRSEILAKYIINNNSTVRAASQHFGLSKSTVHKDITYHLEKINPPLFSAVREILDKNKSERHLRGGEATKQHYIKLKSAHYHNNDCVLLINSTK